MDEESTGTWMDKRTDYDYIYEAVQEFVSRTGIGTATHRFETNTDVVDYAMPADFLGMYLRDRSNRFFVKYTATGSEHDLTFKDYEDIKSHDYYTTYDIKQGSCSYVDGQLVDDGQDFTDWDATSSNDGKTCII